jgi:hypothetical protein
MAAYLSTDEWARYAAYLKDMRKYRLQPRDPAAWVALLRETQTRSSPRQAPPPAANSADDSSASRSVPQSLMSNARMASSARPR